MSTRARIGLELSDGSILSVYHHWDGYTSWLGKKLEEHYNTLESVTELIDGGDMSVCLDDDGNPNPQYYSLYEQDCPPRLDPSLGAYCDVERGEEFHYVYKPIDGEYFWFAIDQHQYDGTGKQPEVVSIPA